MNQCLRKLAVLSLAAATCAALNLSAFAGKECSEPSLKIADETSKQKDARLAWLESAAADAMRAAERKMSDGSVVHVPQGCCKYEAFWLRDYVMMLEGRVVPRERIVPCAKIFLKAVSPEGFGVDCVKFDGTPVYKPGYGTMGANPVLDGCPYTVKLASESWKQTGDGFFLEPVTLDLLEKVLAAIPHAPGGCLPWIDPKAEWDRCPFGFTDSVRKQGECLFSSLLELEARRNFAEMLEAAGRRSAAAAERAKVDRMVKAVESAFWDEATGLYRAATVKCREHDIWGSAYAVWLGIAAPARVRRVAEYFRDHLDGLVQKGQIRQLPPGTYWEKTLTGRDSYQNGAYWGTATGWFAWTLAKVDRAKAMSLFDDLVADYKARNANEWVFGARTDCPQYLSSLALPLQALRRMRSSRAY